ncbi:MAG: hypothetical protein J6X44_01665, partial [Thermoguttaceae bacterium]|nr:hypothetical protein [Thermoguttaceae bacterium]
YIVLPNQKYISKVTENYGVEPGRIQYVEMWRRFPEYTEPRYTKRALFFGSAIRLIKEIDLNI